MLFTNSSNCYWDQSIVSRVVVSFFASGHSNRHTIGCARDRHAEQYLSYVVVSSSWAKLTATKLIMFVLFVLFVPPLWSILFRHIIMCVLYAISIHSMLLLLLLVANERGVNYFPLTNNKWTNDRMNEWNSLPSGHSPKPLAETNWAISKSFAQSFSFEWASIECVCVCWAVFPSKAICDHCLCREWRCDTARGAIRSENSLMVNREREATQWAQLKSVSAHTHRQHWLFVCPLLIDRLNAARELSLCLYATTNVCN